MYIRDVHLLIAIGIISLFFVNLLETSDKGNSLIAAKTIFSTKLQIEIQDSIALLDHRRMVTKH